MTCPACKNKDALIKALVGSAIQPTIRDGADAYRCLLCEWTWLKGAEPSHDIELGCPLASIPAAWQVAAWNKGEGEGDDQ